MSRVFGGGCHVVNAGFDFCTHKFVYYSVSVHNIFLCVNVAIVLFVSEAHKRSDTDLQKAVSLCVICYHCHSLTLRKNYNLNES